MNNDRNHSYRLVFNGLLLAAVASVCVTTLQAHPGHGMLGQDPLHLVASPYHLGGLALLGFLLFGSAHLLRRQMPRRAVQALGTSAIVLSAVLWGLRV